MGRPTPDLTGQKFHRLTVISRAGSLSRRAAWLCECECGNTTVAAGPAMLNGSVKSCGCWRREMPTIMRTTHGFAGKNKAGGPRRRSRVYGIWGGMKQRCFNPNTKHFDRYGGRGITVCERWLVFENFLADMGEPPGPNYSIERKDNNGNYEPDNCCWATKSEQMKNRRFSPNGERHGMHKLTETDVRRIRGEVPLTAGQIAKAFDIDIRTVFAIRSHLTWKHVT